MDYVPDKTLTPTQPSETCNPTQEAKNDQASFRTSALQMRRYLTNYQRKEEVPFTAVTKEGVADNANTETEFDTPPSKQPTETESAPSTPLTPSIPKKTIFPKIPGEIGMSESRWAKESVSPNSRKPRQGGQNSWYGRGGSLSGGHSPSSSRQGSIVSLQQSQGGNWDRKYGGAQESSGWGDSSAGAWGTDGGDRGTDFIPTSKPGDEAYGWGSDSIVEGAKQLKDGRGTDSVPAETLQAQIDGNGWGSDTAPAAFHRGRGAKEESHDWGAQTGNDDYSHSRPSRGGLGGRGGYGGNQAYGRLNTQFGETSSDWNSPSAHKHAEENSDWGTVASPQTKYGENEASNNWASTGLADFSAPRSARGGRGGGRGDYQRDGRGPPRGQGSWNGVAQSAYNRSTDVKAGFEPAEWVQGNAGPSWGGGSDFATPGEAKNPDWGQPDVSKNSQDTDSPSSPTQVPTSSWDNMPGWQPSRYKKHEPKW